MMTHNCTHMLEMCVNNNGGFSCECRMGYIRNSTLGDGCYSKSYRLVQDIIAMGHFVTA